MDYIGNTASYIEEHLKNNICLESIANEVSVSKFHLNRIFSAITGLTLMAYVTSRRLTSSLYELLNTNMRIIDIAGEYGFKQEHHYIRAFKKEFGITPAKYRRTKCELKITAPINMDSLIAINEKSILIKPVMIVKPAFFVIGDQCRVDKTAYVDTSYLTEFAKNFYDKKMPLIKNVIDNQVYYGHCLYDGDYTFYTSCVETPEDEQPPEGLVKLQIPTNNYWVFKYAALHSNRNITYTEFFHIFETVYQWLTAEKQPFPEYHFEKIDDRVCTDSYCELDLYVPAAK